MKIKQILSQHRRDFTAIYMCGHCGKEENGGGYDDTYFHQTVIPNMVCGHCGKKGEADYSPLPTRYPDSMTI